MSSKSAGARSVIDDFRTSGSLKALFPRAADLSGIIINTSGGLTGGDRLSVQAHAGRGSQMTLTTQAAERAYRSSSGVAEMRSVLHVSSGARLRWLPQELILFDGCALRRALDVTLEHEAEVLIVEPIVFGRFAMGETLCGGTFTDRITVRRGDQPIYHDALRLTGDIATHLNHLAIGQGLGAMCSLVHVAKNVESHLDALRQMMPQTGGVSCLAPDVLVMRLMAQDSFALRKTLLPVLDRLTGHALPTSWRL